MPYRNPKAIVSCEWLAAHLDDPKIRVFDCTTSLSYDAPLGQPYTTLSGKDDYIAGHIPRAGFLDLTEDFSDQKSALAFTLPSRNTLRRRFGEAGVDLRSHTVLYSQTEPQWAARFWWMLHFLGVDNVSILDGGWKAWTLAKYPVSHGWFEHPKAKLPRLIPKNAFIDQAGVKKAISDTEVQIIDTLSPEIHNGFSMRYGRPGHIPGSCNLPAVQFVDADSGLFVAEELVRAHFNRFPLTDGLVTYCGSGIWASLVAFFAYQIGFQNVSVYDNSLSEWAKNKQLPLETHAH